MGQDDKYFLAYFPKESGYLETINQVFFKRGGYVRGITLAKNPSEARCFETERAALDTCDMVCTGGSTVPQYSNDRMHYYTMEIHGYERGELISVLYYGVGVSRASGSEHHLSEIEEYSTFWTRNKNVCKDISDKRDRSNKEDIPFDQGENDMENIEWDQCKISADTFYVVYREGDGKYLSNGFSFEDADIDSDGYKWVNNVRDAWHMVNIDYVIQIRRNIFELNRRQNSYRIDKYVYRPAFSETIKVPF